MGTRTAAAALLVCLGTHGALGTIVRLPAAQDNTIFEDSELSDGRGTGLFVGKTATGSTRRALLSFDLSSIPAGSTIVNASLTLHMSRTVTSSEPVELHVCLASWGEGASNSSTGGGGGGAPASLGDATWTQRSFGNSLLWLTAGGDFRSQASAVAGVAGVNFYSWGGAGVVGDVQAWVNNSVTNFGWFVTGNEGSPQTAKRFDSREATNPSFAPVLEVEYVPAPGCLLIMGTVLVRGRRR